MHSETAGDSIRQDMRYLAGTLPHRGANTENERTAAEYIHKRFKENTNQSAIEDFHSIDTYHFLFASYMGEFFIVSLVAFWFPLAALIYGSIVFVTYIAEFTGYRVASRLLPEYASQNVTARFPGARGKRQIVVLAHYDSPKDTPLAKPQAAQWLRPVHFGLVACMMVVILSCLMGVLELFQDGPMRVDLVSRWAATGILVTAAGALALWEAMADFQPGANNNASGTAVLLELANRLRETPPEDADVWLVATGSKEGWLNGVRDFIVRHDLDQADAYMVNIEQVGAGELACIEGEGLLHTFHSDKALTALMLEEGEAFNAQSRTHRGVPTDLLIPLTRGYRAAGIMGAESPGTERHTDSLAHVDFQLAWQAANWAEQVVRRLDTDAAEKAKAEAPGAVRAS